MSKKAKIAIIIVTLAVLFALLVPVRVSSYDDGGTRCYDAALYKVVVWNRIVGTDMDIYHSTSVYWYPDNHKFLDELWELEQAK